MTYGTPIQQNFDEYIARVDQVFRGGQDRLFGRFYLNKYHHAPTFDGKDLLTVGPGSTITSQNWAIGYTRVFTSNLVNNFVLDFVRSASDRGQQGGPGGAVPDMSTFGSSIWQLPEAQSGIRSFAVSGDFTIGNFTDAKFIRNTYNLRELINWTKGKHTLSLRLRSRVGSVEHSEYRPGEWQLQLHQRRHGSGDGELLTGISAYVQPDLGRLSRTPARTPWASSATTSGRSRRGSR